MPPSMQVELTCIIAGVLIAVFNPLGRVPAAGRGSSFKGAQQDGRLGTRQALFTMWGTVSIRHTGRATLRTLLLIR